MRKAAAFITGGSSGIGLEMAQMLAERGHPVAIFARKTSGLNAAIKAIHKVTPDASVRSYPVDVGDRQACINAVTRAVADLGPPGWAIANAGIAEPGEFMVQPLDLHEQHMRINYFGALYFARAAIDAMTDTGGKLIFVASGAAFFGIHGYSAYAPSKFAMRGLAEVLRIELAPKGISVTLAYPPDTNTPMLAVEERTKPSATKVITAGGGLWSAASVAELILRRADAGKFTAAPGAQMKALLILHSVLGPALRAWQARIVRRCGKD